MAGGVKSLEDCRRGKPRLPGDLYLVFPRRSNEFSSITRAFKVLSLSLFQGERGGQLSWPCIGVLDEPWNCRRKRLYPIDVAFYAAESTDIRGGTRAKVRRGKAKTGEGKTGRGRYSRLSLCTIQRQMFQLRLFVALGYFSWRKYLREHSFAREGISNNSFASSDISGLIIVSEQLRWVCSE